jgi:hypothetical protein
MKAATRRRNPKGMTMNQWPHAPVPTQFDPHHFISTHFNHPSQPTLQPVPLRNASL